MWSNRCVSAWLQWPHMRIPFSTFTSSVCRSVPQPTLGTKSILMLTNAGLVCWQACWFFSILRLNLTTWQDSLFDSCSCFVPFPQSFLILCMCTWTSYRYAIITMGRILWALDLGWVLSLDYDRNVNGAWVVACSPFHILFSFKKTGHLHFQ